jgi:2OG-Fe(II) oxygenase superfamily
MDSPYFVIGNTNTQIIADPEQIRPAYASQRALLCRNAIEPDLLARLAKASSNASFVSDTVDGIGHRWIERPSMVGAAIELVLNRPNMHGWFKAVTNCTKNGGIEGRLVETRLGGEDQLTWHNDTMVGTRYAFGLTLHLRPCLYQGGAFEMRDHISKQPVFEHVQANAGDLLIFEVNPRSEHRVTRVDSGEPRLVFTGWFIADPTD